MVVASLFGETPSLAASGTPGKGGYPDEDVVDFEVQDPDLPVICQLADTVLDAHRSLLGAVPDEYIERGALVTLNEIEMKMIKLQDWIANEDIMPAYLVHQNYFEQFNTEENRGLSYYYMDALFFFARRYFSATDEERAQIKYKIHLAHRIAVNGPEAEWQRPLADLVKELGRITTERL